MNVKLKTLFIMKVKILCFFLILIISCNKSTDNLNDSNVSMICSIDAEVLEIIDPPEVPAVYPNSLVKPIIKVKNEEVDYVITSMEIDYLIDKENLHNGWEKGPQTKWTGTLNYGEEVIIQLNEWDTAGQNTPLVNGTHSLFIEISGVNDDCTGNIYTGNPMPLIRQFRIDQ